MPRKPLIKKLDLYGQVDIGGSDPSSGVDGQLFYNTATSSLKIYISGIWTAIGGGSVVDGTFDFMNGSDLQFMNGNSAAFMSG